MASYRKIRISVSNDELDALENLLVAKLTPARREICRKKAFKICARLVKEWKQIDAELAGFKNDGNDLEGYQP